MDTLSSVIVSPEAGTVIHVFGDEITIHLGAAQTDGKSTLFTQVTPPGGGPPPHYHLHEDEWFFPLEGRVEFLLDGQWKEVPMGTAVFAPRGSVHTFRNPGSAPLKMLVHTAPAGFELFFVRCAEVFAQSAPVDMERILEISAEHGIHFVGQEDGESASL